MGSMNILFSEIDCSRKNVELYILPNHKHLGETPVACNEMELLSSEGP